MAYKRLVISKFGGPEVLEVIKEETLPEPNKDEVRVKVLRASANFTDVMIRKGKYPEVREKPPFSLGYDMIGIVDKVGSDVKELKVGDKVADLTVIGAQSEYICLKSKQVVKVEDDIDDSKAVTLILSYMTAYQMMRREASLEEGDSILIHGAAGAVGIAMLQLGKLHKLRVYGTASKEKHDIVREYGGIPIDYKNQDFVEEIMRLEPDGLDAVFDAIGGDYFKRSFSTLRKGGKLVAYGFYNAVMGKGGSIVLEFIKLLLWNILPNGKKTSFYIITSLRRKHPKWFKEDLRTLFKHLADNEIAPMVSAQYKLEDAQEVHKMIEESKIIGKVVYKIS